MTTRAMPFRGSYTSREQVAVYEFNWLVLMFDAADRDFPPGVRYRRRLRWLAVLDLPMMVVIFFAVARRNPVSGCITGAIIGLLQDALGGPSHPIGMFGITDTIIGYAASSLGVKIDVENPGYALPDHLWILCHPRGCVLRSGTRPAAAAAAVELEPRGDRRPGECGGGGVRVSPAGPV